MGIFLNIGTNKEPTIINKKYIETMSIKKTTDEVWSLQINFINSKVVQSKYFKCENAVKKFINYEICGGFVIKED